MIKGFRAIKEYPDYYVNNKGQVLSTKYNESRILKERKDKYGYISVFLSNTQGNKNIYVHRLVAIAFIPNHNNKKYVNHINSIKHDNRVENLEWCTPRENTIHSFLSGNRKIAKGEKNNHNKLTGVQVLEIREKRKNGRSATSLGIEYNVAKCNISAIVNRKTWKHL